MCERDNFRGLLKTAGVDWYAMTSVRLTYENLQSLDLNQSTM